MKKKTKFFFFVFGKVAKYFVENLIYSNKNFKFCATNTKKSGVFYFRKKKFKSFKFKDDIFDKRLIKDLENTDYVLISIPPRNKKDTVLRKFRKNLVNSSFKKLIYLSATSVYGNHYGKWVNEKSKLKGRTIFGLKRRLAEKSWCEFRDKNNLDINIIRVSGIYSKESNVLNKILNRNIYVKEKKFFSRIRVEDLANIIKKTYYTSRKSMIINASDDKPSTNKEVAFYAAKLLKIKKLVPVPISKFKNLMIKEFYKDSKKVSNKKMKKELKVKLRYPTYKQGLKNIFNNYH